MDQFIIWLVSFMVSVAPPDRVHFIDEAKETKEEALLRYESIATDIATVVTTEAPVFKGEDARLKTSSIILSLMFFEGGFRKDVDTGLGKLAKGDNGNSACLMQLNVGKGRTIKWNTKEDRVPRWGDAPEDIHQGWTAEELLSDRKICIAGGLRTIRMSFRACGKLQPSEWLRAYASGSCEKGSKESKSRMNFAFRWYSMNRPDFKDVDLLPKPAQEPTENEPVTVALL